LPVVSPRKEDGKINQYLWWILSAYFIIGSFWGLFVLEMTFCSKKFVDPDDRIAFQEAQEEDREVCDMPIYLLVPVGIALFIRCAFMWLCDVLDFIEEA
jgi:hypothetical protein